MSNIAFSCLLIGLDNAGKTTMLYHIKTNMFAPIVEIYPTTGFELHTVTVGSNKTILVYDCSGQGRSRDGWAMFFSEVEGVVYVIDSTDIDRLSIVKENMEIVLNNSKNKALLKKSPPLVIMLNKQDENAKAINKDTLKEFLKLDQFKSSYKKMMIKETSGYTGSGVLECFEWLTNSVLKK